MMVSVRYVKRMGTGWKFVVRAEDHQNEKVYWVDEKHQLHGYSTVEEMWREIRGKKLRLTKMKTNQERVEAVKEFFAKM